MRSLLLSLLEGAEQKISKPGALEYFDSMGQVEVLNSFDKVP